MEISRRFTASPNYCFLYWAGTVAMGEDPGLWARILGFQSRLCWKWVSAKKRAKVFGHSLSLKDLENQRANIEGKRGKNKCIKGWWYQVGHSECKLMLTSHQWCLVLGERASSFPSPLLPSSTFPRFIPHLLLSSLPPSSPPLSFIKQPK